MKEKKRTAWQEMAEKSVKDYVADTETHDTMEGGPERKNSGKKRPVEEDICSEDILESDEEKSREKASTSTVLSVAEMERKKIRERNLRCYKMVRNKEGLTLV